jgi:hypothetical protein
MLVLVLLLLALSLFFFRKSIFKERKTSRTEATRSIWGGRSSMASTLPEAPLSFSVPPIYIPPTNMKQKQPLMSPLTLNPNTRRERIVSNSTERRQERLARVRNLPGSAELKTEPLEPVEQDVENRGAIGLARGSGIVSEKGAVGIEASAEPWEDPAAAKRESGAESEASLPRWRTPVSWVRDQRMRGWGRLSG